MKCRDKYFLNIAFPPKKLSNTSSKVILFYLCLRFISVKILESRREDLEKYLQCLAKIYPLPIELIEFLELENFSGSENSPSMNIYLSILNIKFWDFVFRWEFWNSSL